MVTLKEALDLAAKNNLNQAVSQTLIDQAAAREKQARAAGFPKVIGTAILSPIYRETGDALRSERDLDSWGIWLQSSVTILQPVFAWGKLSSLREAAARGSDVAKAQFRKDLDQLAYDVKGLFYGAILTEQLYRFLDDGKKDVEEILGKADEDQKKKRPSIAKRDYYRLKIFAAEAKFRFEEAKKLRTLARHALSLQLGFDPNEQTIPQDTTLTAIPDAPPSEEQLIALMVQNRPELAQVTNGIAAKRALLEAEKTNKFPIFFVGGMLTFGYSNMRERQQSAYAFDPYNRSTGGVGAGVQWTWDFATTLANEALLQAEIDELERKELYAKTGFRLELKKVLADMAEAQSRLEASRDAFTIGKKWLVSETMGYSIGVSEIKNLIDAYLARAKTVKDHWEAIYKVNMTWAELTRAVGTEVTPGLSSPAATTNSQ
ncbi:MAG: TolC family protein [Bdellovibrionota bacterium]